jgi:sulfite exporter TauE/SafE
MGGFLEHSQYLVAFVTGLLGGVHCVGMCGGIVAALSLGARPTGDSVNFPAAQNKKPTFSCSKISILLGYNLGRIAGYVTAGIVVAGLSATLVDLTGINTLKQILAVIASLFMIALGLYLAGLWQGLAKIEILGSGVWRRIQPFTKRFMPVRNVQQAIPLGFLWGWLPCGLVYTALTWTLSAGSAIEGGLIMLAFGLGTLPNLLAMGVLAERLSGWVRNPNVCLVSGLLVVLLGILTLFRI